MARFEGIQIGNSWVVDRCKLIAALERIQLGDNFQSEQQRRQRIAQFYQQAQREHPAGQIPILVTRESWARTLISLPSSVQLVPGELRIQFSSLEEFLTKLFELGQAIQNDFQQFQELLANAEDHID